MKKSYLKAEMAFICASLAFILPMAGCSSDEPANEGGGTDSGAIPVIELTTEANEAAAAVQDFNIDFFRNVALSDDYKGKNVACSPLSATMLLSLLSNAASDETAAEIASVMGYSGSDDLNDLYVTLATELPSLDPKAELAFANSVWYHQDYTLTDNFSDIARGYYKADIFKRDMSGASENVRDEINSWVNDNTRGLIRNINAPFPVLSTLINATYFKAAWKDAFKAENTKKAVFRGLSGESQIDMMYREGIYLYERSAEYEAIEIPFGSGAFSATFILPSGDVEEFVESDALNRLWSYEPSPRNISLSLPRFKIAEDKEINLTNILSNMGVKSLTASGQVKIFKESTEAESIRVLQKTSVEFNEQGAEAAAVTWSGMDGAANNITVSFDRPFIFMISEKSTKTILFAGKVLSL